MVVPFFEAPDTSSMGVEDFTRAETDIPFDEDVKLVEEELGLELAGPIAEASEKWFGLESETFLSSGLVEIDRIEPGREIYLDHCAGCHAENGDGGGPAARFLDPRPRNFRRGIFKFTSTPTGAKPLRSDIFDVITNGLSGASMPKFPLLSEQRRHDVVEYVRYLSMRGEYEDLLLGEAYNSEEVPDGDDLAPIIIDRWLPEMQRAVYPDTPETTRDQASIDRGRELFMDTSLTSCVSCHGETGKGDGPAAGDYTDDWGYPIVPRDFTVGVFRAGDTPEALWRSIATGINGTPMGSFGGNLDGDQIWDLVHFTQSLAEGN